jgi:hypothetical protein
MLFQSRVSPLALPLVVLLVLCPPDKCHHEQAMLVEAEVKTKGRVRGESLTNLADSGGPHRRRQLFADMWSDPSNASRGGAGAAAKDSNEVIFMRSRVTDAPSPSAAVTTNPTATTTVFPTLLPASTAPSNTTLASPPPTMDSSARNDRCEAATPMQLGTIYKDTTIGARIPTVLPDRCNRITNSASGVWYSVVGTGSPMTASLCHPDTDFDSKLTVYAGSCTDVMDCIDSNDDADGTLGTCDSNRQASRVEWDSTADTLYYILVHGFGARVGNFQLDAM